jgi:CRISPR-associated protein Cas2
VVVIPIFVILVYDTAVERNPKVLKTCRKYLHWTQRSVFQGELSSAQYRALVAALKVTIDPDYDSILTYTVRSPDLIATDSLGAWLGGPGDIL